MLSSAYFKRLLCGGNLRSALGSTPFRVGTVSWLRSPESVAFYTKKQPDDSILLSTGERNKELAKEKLSPFYAEDGNGGVWLQAFTYKPSV